MASIAILFFHKFSSVADWGAFTKICRNGKLETTILPEIGHVITTDAGSKLAVAAKFAEFVDDNKLAQFGFIIRRESSRTGPTERSVSAWTVRPLARPGREPLIMLIRDDDEEIRGTRRAAKRVTGWSSLDTTNLAPGSAVQLVREAGERSLQASSATESRNSTE